jgi:3-oxoacid CoA-transferase subunit B
MEHSNKEGESKVLKACKLPLTGKKVVHRIITDLCVMDVAEDGLHLLELAPGVGVDEVRAKTEAKLHVPPSVPTIAGLTP